MEKKTKTFGKQGIEKIVISVGLGKLRNNAQFEEKILPEIIKEVAVITGQKPALRRAKKSIAGFKTRTGDIIGLQVTLRGKRRNDFLNRLINIIFPRVKDFRGLEIKNVDGGGNFNVGFKDQFVFPEISADQSKVNFGLQVTVVPILRNHKKAMEFYGPLGMPFKSQS